MRISLRAKDAIAINSPIARGVAHIGERRTEMEFKRNSSAVRRSLFSVLNSSAQKKSKKRAPAMRKRIYNADSPRSE